MSDGQVEGANLICGVHHWDYRLDTGVSAQLPQVVGHADMGPSQKLQPTWIPPDRIRPFAGPRPRVAPRVVLRS